MLRVFANVILIASLARSKEYAEESMTVAELVQHFGYTLESHYITTEDGYILSLLRIPHGRNAGNEGCHRPPILLVHGLLSDAADFVENPPESAPGMILADTGFDVFLLNHRGTTHSKRHARLNKSDPEFWKYSLDEFANYDAIAAIEKALDLNGANSLYWIGHSQIRALFQLAPVGTLFYSETFGKFLALFLTSLRPILIKPQEIGFHFPWLVGGAARMLCTSEISKWCRDIHRFAVGPPASSENWTHFPQYLSNLLVGTSSWTLLQIGENAHYNHVNHFDGTPEINLKRYGSIHPPPYNYSNIDTDVYLFWSRNDWLTTPLEIEKFLAHKLRHGVIKKTFEIPEYNHLDFVGATDVAEKVFSKIITIVRSYEPTMCNY